MCAYQVTLAVGNAARHDTGGRIRMTVVAESPLDAAVIAENHAERQALNTEYVYARTITPMNQLPPAAMAMAA